MAVVDHVLILVHFTSLLFYKANVRVLRTLGKKQCTSVISTHVMPFKNGVCNSTLYMIVHGRRNHYMSLSTSVKKQAGMANESIQGGYG